MVGAPIILVCHHAQINLLVETQVDARGQRRGCVVPMRGTRVLVFHGCPEAKSGRRLSSL